MRKQIGQKPGTFIFAYGKDLVLEVAVKLAAKARSVQGIDPSPRMLEKGREKVTESGRGPSAAAS